MTTIQRDFSPADRYRYDLNECSVSRGWAQIDTNQDASYFGQWINPARHLIFCYCEGDLILTTCDTDADLQAEIAKMVAWNLEQGLRFIGIDPGFSEQLKADLIAVGLEQYLH